jgi:hypothetical protein
MNPSDLVGTWRLTSWVTEDIESRARSPLNGERPRGYLVFTPEGRLIVVMTGEGRKTPQSDEDRVSAFNTLAAYTGKYRIEGDRFIAKVDVAWNEGWTGSEQTRLYRMDGDTLHLESVPAPSLTSGRLVRNIVTWKRDRS